MVGFAIFDNNPFDVRSTKSTNTGRQAFTAKQAFIDPDAEIEDAIIKGSKPSIYTQNSQNNPENSERFFSAQNNFNSESVSFSQAATVNVAKFYSDRSFGNGSTKYGSGLSSFASNNQAPLGRQLVLSA